MNDGAVGRRADRLPASRPAGRPAARRHAGRRRDAGGAARATAGWSTTRPSARSRSFAGRSAARRPIDADTGDQGGTTEGVFVSEWRGDILYGRNDAVGGHYILGYGDAARARPHRPRRRRRAASCSGTRTTTPTAASSSFRSRSGRFSCPSRCPATTSRPSASSAFASTAREGSTSTPTSGTRASSPSPERSASSTSRARCTPASRSISRESSRASSRRRSGPARRAGAPG